MHGFLLRNSSGVKEIREGDVLPVFDLDYRTRHTMSEYNYSCYWNNKSAWEKAKVIKVHPGLYWAFPEQGRIEFGMYGGFAIPTNIAPIILELKGNKCLSGMHRNMKFERMLYPDDGGYRFRRNSRDGGL